MTRFLLQSALLVWGVGAPPGGQSEPPASPAVIEPDVTAAPPGSHVPRLRVPVLRPLTAPPLLAESPPRDAEAARAGRWYGWQLILSDLAFCTLTLKGWESDVSRTVGIAGLVIVAPALHILNGDDLTGMVSGALRLTVLLACYRLTVLANASDSLGDSVVALGIAAAGGVLVAVADIGFTYTTHQPVWERGKRPPRRALVSATIMPLTSMRSTGAGLGLAGAF